MKWNYCIGRFAGAPIYMHVSVPLYVLWAALTHKENPDLPLLSGAPFALLLLLSELWHEIAHVRVAKRVGVGAKSVYLTPFAGFTMLKKMPALPAHDRAIAWAGLAATLYLAVFGFVAALLVQMVEGETFLWASLLTLCGINAMLFLINVLPLFPTDGGKILRSLLAEFLHPVTATAIAAVLGTVGALVMLLFTWYIHPIMWFVWLLLPVGAWLEHDTVRSWAQLKGIPVQSVMQTDFDTVALYDTVAEVAQRLPEDQKQFPVMKNGKVVGMLTREALQREMEQQHGHLPVRRVMCREVEKAQITDCLDEVYLTLEASDADAMVVMQGEQLVGLLTRERVEQLLETMQQLSLADKARQPGTATGC